MMTQEREVMLPLVLGAVLALLLHLAAAPVAMVALVPGGSIWPMSPASSVTADAPELAALEHDREDALPDEDDDETSEPEVMLGQEDSPLQASVAWISYDAYREMTAPQSRTQQPALQQEADPTPEAPLEVESSPQLAAAAAPAQAAAPPVMVPPVAAQPQTEAPAPAAQQPEAPTPQDAPANVSETPDPARANQAPQLEMPELDERLAAAIPHTIGDVASDFALPQPEDEPREFPVPSEAEHTDEADAAPPRSASPADAREADSADLSEARTATPNESQPVQTPAPAPDSTTGVAQAQASTPTAAPRDERETDPASLTDPQREVVPGSVLTAQGIEIETFKPRPSLETRLSTIPNNPVAHVVFNRQGEVIKAWLDPGTGAANWDAPVLASLYLWRARGKRLDELTTDTFRLEITIILSAEP